MCLNCCNLKLQRSLGLAESSMDSSGSIAENEKFDGPGATTMKFEGIKSSASSNKGISNTGFGG